MIDLNRKIGIWGDSVLKGVIFDEVKGVYELLAENCAAQISRILSTPILNKARFGCTIDNGFSHLERSIRNGLDCDLVLLEFGGNDCDFDWPAVSADPQLPHLPHTELGHFRQMLHEMITLLRQNQIEPLLMSLPPIVGERYFDFLVSKGLDRANLLHFLGDPHQIYRFHESYSLAVTQVAAMNRCLYAPVRETFLATRNSPDLICADGIHPNERGHLLMQQVFTAMAVS
jgi:acyl-CoA thioesterase-1